MQREFTAVPSNWSVGQTIDYLRENKDLPKEFLEILLHNDLNQQGLTFIESTKNPKRVQNEFYYG